MTSDDEGEGGVRIPPEIDDVIYEQPLTTLMVMLMVLIVFAVELMIILLQFL